MKWMGKTTILSLVRANLNRDAIRTRPLHFFQGKSGKNNIRLSRLMLNLLQITDGCKLTFDICLPFQHYYYLSRSNFYRAHIHPHPANRAKFSKRIISLGLFEKHFTNYFLLGLFLLREIQTEARCLSVQRFRTFCQENNLVVSHLTQRVYLKQNFYQPLLI